MELPLLAYTTGAPTGIANTNLFQRTICVPNNSAISSTNNVSIVSFNSVYAAKFFPNPLLSTHGDITLTSRTSRDCKIRVRREFEYAPRFCHLAKDISANFPTTRTARSKNFICSPRDHSFCSSFPLSSTALMSSPVSFGLTGHRPYDVPI
jgi:hypothetical protein